AAAQVGLEARIGAAYSRAGALEKANRVFQDVSRKANRQVAAEVADLHLLEGEVLLARGEAARAIEVLSVPDQPSNPRPRRLCLYGAVDRNGDSQQAMAVIGSSGWNWIAVGADRGRRLDPRPPISSHSRQLHPPPAG
ncbi:MAG: hypothetical protein C0506_17175, partial [Anaerolinea sp.]|nr:hypothetical protein [Anaerolinea sp.]